MALCFLPNSVAPVPVVGAGVFGAGSRAHGGHTWKQRGPCTVHTAVLAEGSRGGSAGGGLAQLTWWRLCNSSRVGREISCGWGLVMPQYMLTHAVAAVGGGWVAEGLCFGRGEFVGCIAYDP